MRHSAEVDVERVTRGSLVAALNALERAGVPEDAALEIAPRVAEASTAKTVALPPGVTIRARW